MTDHQLRTYFGLTERALVRLNAMRDFPKRDTITNRRDSRAVDLFFDRMSGLEPPARNSAPSVDHF
ncbi:hypothetical protein ASG54_13000 [Aureimonas sp. Leaf460]|nr:hypothetical protein ASG62_09130 [Aureimonas sp. Leaf427]KQT77151.1 hypothetical protein ASG54_13000 [Aureimonas sp. Leaf460]